MNDTEINAIANGVFMYLKKECKEPPDAIAVILCLTLLFYEQCKDPSKVYPIEEFAEQFSLDMTHHWHRRKILSEGTETRQ